MSHHYSGIEFCEFGMALFNFIYDTALRCKHYHELCCQTKGENHTSRTWHFLWVLSCLSITSVMLWYVHTRSDWPLMCWASQHSLCDVTRPIKLSWLAYKVWTLLMRKLSIYLPFWRAKICFLCQFLLLKYIIFFLNFFSFNILWLPIIRLSRWWWQTLWNDSNGVMTNRVQTACGHTKGQGVEGILTASAAGGGKMSDLRSRKAF